MFEDWKELNESRIDLIDFPLPMEIKLSVKRDDLIHPKVSGNKLYKLKKNLEKAQDDGIDRIVTFGGAFSNHIAATAAACKYAGLKSVGIIRGEIPEELSRTLAEAQANGMFLKFISRSDYKKKNTPEYLEYIAKLFPESYIIPEGGANLLGIEGSKAILEGCEDYDYVVCAMGTGTTFAGLVHARHLGQKIIGVPVHKHDNLKDDIIEIDSSFAKLMPSSYEILPDYHFGGYAKWTEELITFMRSFHKKTGLVLDPIYTGKAMFALLDLLRNGYYAKGSHILFIHTGGIQGIEGFEKRFSFRIYD